MVVVDANIADIKFIRYAIEPNGIRIVKILPKMQYNGYPGG
jgi:hypothetical protein